LRTGARCTRRRNACRFDECIDGAKHGCLVHRPA
jgi:hypothetical protein